MSINMDMVPRPAIIGRAARLRPMLLFAVLSLCVAVVLVFARVGVANAAFGSASLLSGTTELEFEDADAPALAGEGGYVAFQGSLAGVSGVWRRDLSTGAIEPVAAAYDPEDSQQRGAPTVALSAPDASAPSISANGEYVAFTTTADLEPLHAGEQGRLEGEPPADEGCPEVYVRDMDKQPGEEGAYVLASALTGGEGISYTGHCGTVGAGFAVAGAQAAPDVALSADGRSVVFTVLSTSNLTRGPGCAAGTPSGECPTETPASQVAVHDTETGATTVVSVTPQGEPAPGGGAYPSMEDEQHMSSTAEASAIGEQITGSSAAISADGGTVAWMGTDVPAQVPASTSEITSSQACHGAPGSEVEPLWRHIADGTDASTQRLLAGAGLDFFYNRVEPGEVVCAGSFVDTVSWQLFIPPALSADGETVAVTANAPRPEALRSAELNSSEGRRPTTDAYVVHLSDAPGATPQVTPLTETPDYDEATVAVEGFIDDIAISPDGERVAFESASSEFTLPNLTPISPPLPAAEFDPQTYEANLQQNTLQRVTVTYNGTEPTGSAGLLSLEDGGTVAFASSAKNLFYGDAVNASEVYLTRELPAEQPPAQQSITAIPPEQLLHEQALQPEWRLDATATAQPNGSVIVYAQAPGPGQLTVTATAQLPPSNRHKTKGEHKTAHKAGSVKPARASASVRLLTKTVAHSATAATVAAPVRLTLKTGTAYRSLVTSPGGLYSVLKLTFSAPGHPALTQTIPVTFHRTEHTKTGKKGKTTAKRKTTRRATVVVRGAAAVRLGA